MNSTHQNFGDVMQIMHSPNAVSEYARNKQNKEVVTLNLSSGAKIKKNIICNEIKNLNKHNNKEIVEKLPDMKDNKEYYQVKNGYANETERISF